MSDRFRQAIDAIDAANAADPNRILVRGEPRPKELAHSELVSQWVEVLLPNASEALRLAARAHHLRRWQIPRAEYPEGRRGYLRWRRALHVHHAQAVSGLLSDAGYDDATIERVEDIVQKKDLGRDPEVQVFEDALCLVFLETQLHDLAARLDEPKLLDVASKTLRKMSAAGIARAQELDLPPSDRALLEAVLASWSP